jgi:hypothetical protein
MTKEQIDQTIKFLKQRNFTTDEANTFLNTQLSIFNDLSPLQFGENNGYDQLAKALKDIYG